MKKSQEKIQQRGLGFHAVDHLAHIVEGSRRHGHDSGRGAKNLDLELPGKPGADSLYVSKLRPVESQQPCGHEQGRGSHASLNLWKEEGIPCDVRMTQTKHVQFASHRPSRSDDLAAYSQLEREFLNRSFSVDSGMCQAELLQALVEVRRPPVEVLASSVQHERDLLTSCRHYLAASLVRSKSWVKETVNLLKGKRSQQRRRRSLSSRSNSVDDIRKRIQEWSLRDSESERQALYSKERGYVASGDVIMF